MPLANRLERIQLIRLEEVQLLEMLGEGLRGFRRNCRLEMRFSPSPDNVEWRGAIELLCNEYSASGNRKNRSVWGSLSTKTRPLGLACWLIRKS